MRRRLLATVTGCAILVLGVTTASAEASAVPSTNGKISFNPGGPNDFTSGFTIDPDGTHAHQIGSAGNVTCTTFSPDGSKILCNVWSDTGVQPATANPDGSDFTLLNPRLPMDLFCLFWSPNGARLLCHSEGVPNPGDAGLYTVRSTDAGGRVRVTATPADSSDIGYGFSPAGTRILYSRFDSSDKGILYSVKADGSGLIQLSPSDLGIWDLDFNDVVGADWSPDGSQVTFAATWKPSPGRGLALYVVNSDGTHFRQVTPAGIGAISAQWSPDGQLIAFSTKRIKGTPPPDVWVIHPDGTGLHQITRGNAAATAPVSSPDGQKLLFNQLNRDGTDSLWTVRTDGQGLTKLADVFAPTSYYWGTAPVG